MPATCYECALRACGLFKPITPEELSVINDILQERVSRPAGAWFLTIAARLDRILYLLAALLWLEQGFCDITLLCIRHKRPFVVTRMSDIKKFTRNAAQQAVRQTFYQLSDFWKQILV
jgi:hypothetical protein